jgi:hypothetical protein
LSVVTPSRVNWPHVVWFLGLAFGLSWLADLVLYLNGGLASPLTALLLQFQMLLPAFSAMLLGAFFFKESPIYYRSNRTASRWFVYFYLSLTFLYLIGSIAALIQPEQTVTISSLLLIPNLIGLILLVASVEGGRSFAGAVTGQMAFGWLRVAGCLLRTQTFFNLFSAGSGGGLKQSPQLARHSFPALMLTMALNTVIIGPFLG